MRYLLLFGILIAASVTLPFVTMSEEPPSAQPVEPVDVVTLPPMEEAAPDAPAEVPAGSAAAATPEAVLPLDVTADAPETVIEVADAGVTPRGAMPGLVMGNMALGFVSAVPFGVLPHLFDGSDAEGRMTADAPDVSDDAGFERFAALGMFQTEDAAPEAPSAEMADAMVEEIVEDFETVVAEETAPEPATPSESLASVPAPADDRSYPLAPATEEVGSLVMNANSDPIIISQISGVAAPAPAEKPEPAAAPEVAEAPASATDGEVFKVTANALNMRAGPSSSHAVVTGLSKGELAERIGEVKNGWVPVRVKDGEATGWVFARYLARAEGA